MVISMKKNIILLFELLVILGIVCLASYFFAFGGINKRLMSTHTIVTGIRDESKLITASQFVDFVTILVSGDRKNEYIEYQTYKIEAGVDLKRDKTSVRVLNNPIQVDRTVLRGKIDAGKYDAYIKPIRSAYALKACDIAVNYKLLENAQKNISDSDEILWGIQKEAITNVPELCQTNVNYLPCYFETFGDILNEDIKRNLLNSNDLEFRAQDKNFSRDALKIGIKGKGKDTYIQIGYTGKKFENDTFESFKKRLCTENENITVFSYFDPLDDTTSKQVLSYASDSYRTAFILHGGKLYYIDAHAPDAQTRENIGNLVLYLAMSMKFDDEKEDISDDYMKYLEDFDEALYFLRNQKYPEFNTTVKDLFECKNRGVADFEAADTEEERTLAIAAKYFMHEGDVTEQVFANKTFEKYINNCLFLYNSHTKEGIYTEPDKRAELLREIHSQNNKNNNEIYCNMITYFLQNENKFGLTEDEKNAYLKELTGRACTVNRTILESFDTDKQRNEFYAKLFKNSYEVYDKAGNVSEANYHEDIHPDMTFFYTKNAWNASSGSGDLESKLVERMGGLPIGNDFVFVFSESDMPLLGDLKDSKNPIVQFFKDKGKSLNEMTRTVHALVFDNSSVRLFTCLDDDSLAEKAVKSISILTKWMTQKNTVKTSKNVPEFVDFSDWRKMNIYKNGTAFLGFDFSNTANYNVRAQNNFYKTSQYTEIRNVGEILLQLQHAYEDDEFHYELALEFLERQVRNFIYDALWRPSLNVSEGEKDKMLRYNYIWTN